MGDEPAGIEVLAAEQLQQHRRDQRPDHADGGVFVYDEAAQIIRYGESKIDLTPTELRLFVTMLEQPERVFSRDQLISNAYHDNLDVFDRAIDSHIKNLRRKIGKLRPQGSAIVSVYGMGYRFDPDTEESVS